MGTAARFCSRGGYTPGSQVALPEQTPSAHVGLYTHSQYKKTQPMGVLMNCKLCNTTNGTVFNTAFVFIVKRGTGCFPPSPPTDLADEADPFGPQVSSFSKKINSGENVEFPNQGGANAHTSLQRRRGNRDHGISSRFGPQIAFWCHFPKRLL